jgi:hypothetical protein
MRACRVLPALALALITSRVAAQDGSDVLSHVQPSSGAVSVGEGANEIEVRSTLPRDLILSGPYWTPGTALPLSAEKAASIARKALTQVAGEKYIAGWHITGISLSALYGTSYQKWYYTIEFGKMVSFKDPFSGVLRRSVQMMTKVDVAMDGTPGLVRN